MESPRAVAGTGDEADKIIEAFQKFDTDGNGTIDKTEFFALLKMLDSDVWTEDKVTAMGDAFNTWDVDKDGCINYEEFSAWLCAPDGDLATAAGYEPVAEKDPVPPGASIKITGAGVDQINGYYKKFGSSYYKINKEGARYGPGPNFANIRFMRVDNVYSFALPRRVYSGSGGDIGSLEITPTDEGKRLATSDSLPTIQVF
mmetsp:Transcript_29945/g.54819  ORF Transcript_29945/g.54819 Transcript_29945/m.54819 type:complete len:201 (+) Transcript_29945:54-656(+)